MLTIYPINLDFEPPRDDPLYVGNFFNLRGMWWRKRRQRQKLIFSIALAWKNLLSRQEKVPGMISAEIMLTHLTKQVHDAKIIIEKFFKIERIGYSFEDGTRSLTIVSPKKLPPKFIESIEKIQHLIQFDPGTEPKSKTLTVTTVNLRRVNQVEILRKLRELNREDLIPPAKWLMSQPSQLKFYYRPAGKLQARDTSVWPIKSIETWPAWLREELFGKTIDIENAFCQFIVQNLLKKYEHNPKLLELKYSDLLRIDKDKANFRKEICVDVLKLPPTNENIGKVKRLIMSLANGSNISPKLIVNDRSRSEACRIVRGANPCLSTAELIFAGEKLQPIAKQFRNAKKALCVHLLNEKPSRSAQKKIFQLYFEWEKKARYQIWEAVGRTGLHLHDGLDGIITDLTDDQLVQHIARKTSIRVSVDSPEEHCVLLT